MKHICHLIAADGATKTLPLDGTKLPPAFIATHCSFPDYHAAVSGPEDIAFDLGVKRVYALETERNQTRHGNRLFQYREIK